jgi:hypothetical protein
LRSDCCPECGRALRLTLAPDRPARAPFVVGLIAFAAPLGASLCAISGVFYWWARGIATLGQLRLHLVMNVLTLVLAGVALGLWLRYARLLRRQSTPRQWTFALAACAATLAGHVVFLLTLW